MEGILKTYHSKLRGTPFELIIHSTCRDADIKMIRSFCMALRQAFPTALREKFCHLFRNQWTGHCEGGMVSFVGKLRKTSPGPKSTGPMQHRIIVPSELPLKE